MKVNYSLSTQIDSRGKSQILMRINATKTESWRGKTKIYISPDNWDNTIGQPRTARRDAADKRECQDVTKRLNFLTVAIIEKYNDDSSHGKDWLKNTLNLIQWNTDGTLFIQSKTSLGSMTITDSYKMMIKQLVDDKVIEASTGENYEGVMRKVKAFEELSPCLVKEFNEDRFVALMKYIKDSYRVSDNTLNQIRVAVLRWWHWCRKQDKSLAEIEYDSVKLRPKAFGTPYYLTKEERDKLYYATMPSKLTEQVRDVFVLQCLLGCRISDLIRFKKSNIQDGKLVYIAKKTIHSEPYTITVPLHPIAKEIIKKYDVPMRQSLIIRHKNHTYIGRIREAIKAAGIDRLVTIRDSHTGEQVQKWLSEVASTHMARRTFIGCLYEQGFRESDICSMSGHKEGSVSIQRYRAVSDERKQKMIDSI